MAALIAAASYLSVGEVATQLSFHDAGGPDRGHDRSPGHTFRTHAVAAMVVLLIGLEALLHPSFESLRA